VLYDGIDPFEVDTDWPELAYPVPAGFGNEVPRTIHQIYAQAVKCKPEAPLAFAILIRRALEAICDDRGIGKGKGKSANLFRRLEKLVEAEKIPPVLAKMTDVLRTIGNAAAHSGPDEITVPMTWAIDEFFRAIVEYVYVAPAKIAKFEKTVERTKNAREKRGA
jgi:hypothetical protein